jgi:hypothetical protein
VERDSNLMHVALAARIPGFLNPFFYYRQKKSNEHNDNRQ